MLLLVDEKLKQAARVMARDNFSVRRLTLTGEGRGGREEGRGKREEGWVDGWIVGMMQVPRRLWQSRQPQLITY